MCKIQLTTRKHGSKQIKEINKRSFWYKKEEYRKKGKSND